MLLDQHLDQALIDDVIERFETFCGRWRDGSYNIIGKDQVDIVFVSEAVAEAIGVSKVNVTLVSRTALRDGPTDAQVEKFRLASSYSVRRMFRLMHDGINLDEIGRQPSHSASKLERVLEMTLGTRRLQQALDNSFGASFGRLLRHDIVAIWWQYFAFLMEKDLDAAARLEKLIDVTGRSPVIGIKSHFPKDDDPVFLWVH